MKDSTQKPWIGLTTADVGEKTRVTRVVAGSPAYDSGLDLGDEILALDGSRVRSSDLTDRLTDGKKGDVITLTIFRNDHLKEVKVVLGTTPVPNYKLVKSPSPTTLQKEIYQSWLHSAW